METTSQSFTYLRTKLHEWKANDLLLPAPERSWERFQIVATNVILPILHEAKEALEGAGLEVSVTDVDEDTRCLGFYVSDVGLFFAPGEDAMTVHFMARRFTAEAQGYESRFLFSRAKSEPIRRLVEEALLRLLGPRRANAVHQ